MSALSRQGNRLSSWLWRREARSHVAQAPICRHQVKSRPCWSFKFMGGTHLALGGARHPFAGFKSKAGPAGPSSIGMGGPTRSPSGSSPFVAVFTPSEAVRPHRYHTAHNTHTRHYCTASLRCLIQSTFRFRSAVAHPTSTFLEELLQRQKGHDSCTLCATVVCIIQYPRLDSSECCGASLQCTRGEGEEPDEKGAGGGGGGKLGVAGPSTRLTAYTVPAGWPT